MTQTTAHRAGIDVAIEAVTVSAYTIPTDAPEADGTLDWHQTTMVLVEVEGGGRRGLGYSYVDASAATVIHDVLAGIVRGRSVMDVPAAWTAMVRGIRNIGRPGVASCGIAAVDTALWDLKARLLDVPLVTLIGPSAALFVDANGAYDRKRALAVARRIEPFGASWFEEPVSSDDLEGLRLMRDRAPANIEIAAGEYGYDLPYFRRMLGAGAVDVLQADATRCAGITGFLQVGALADAFAIPLSAHTAPSLHLHPGCASLPFCHLEYFHDHVRI